MNPFYLGKDLRIDHNITPKSQRYGHKAFRTLKASFSGGSQVHPQTTHSRHIFTCINKNTQNTHKLDILTYTWYTYNIYCITYLYHNPSFLSISILIHYFIHYFISLFFSNLFIHFFLSLFFIYFYCPS